MQGKQVTKLFAVVAIAASSAAAEPTPPLTNRVTPRVAPAPRPVVHGSAPRVATPPTARDPRQAAAAAPSVGPELGAAFLELVRPSAPRTLPSGAPACGNVASRAPQPIDCGRATPTTASRRGS